MTNQTNDDQLVSTANNNMAQLTRDTIHMTLMMTSAQVVETSVNVTNNSPSRDYSQLDDQTTQTYRYTHII